MVKNQPARAGDTRDSGLIPDLGRSPGVGNDNSLHYSCLENGMDRGACGLEWVAIVTVGLQRKTIMPFHLGILSFNTVPLT